MKQYLFIRLKDGTNRTIRCERFTLTTFGNLYITYENNGIEHEEVIEKEEIDFFGGCGNENIE